MVLNAYSYLQFTVLLYNYLICFWYEHKCLKHLNMCYNLLSNKLVSGKNTIIFKTISFTAVVQWFFVNLICTWIYIQGKFYFKFLYDIVFRVNQLQQQQLESYELCLVLPAKGRRASCLLDSGMFCFLVLIQNFNKCINFF